MSLGARLKEIEDTAGKGKWCALCRLILRSSPPVSRTFVKLRDDPARKKKTCQFCGNVYNTHPPEGAGPHARARRLYNSFAEEEFYTNERACAVGAWVRYAKNRSPGEGGRKKKRRDTSYRRAVKPTPEQKLKQRLTEEAGELFRRWHKEMKAKHGDPFPHVLELEREIAADFYEYRPASDELRRWRSWAALERIVFGEALPETAERVAEYEEKAAAEAAEKQRMEAERLDREQHRQHAETNRSPYFGR